MDAQLEEYIRSVIFPELEKGRPGWDKPHTEAVVRYMKAILLANPQLRLDNEVMITAAYAHDWGYSGLFAAGKPVTLAENRDQKAAHMRLGADKVAGLLQDARFDHLSPAQKARIIHLVAVHDQLDELRDIDELVLMEADTLGTTDPTIATPTHSRAEYEQWRKNTEERRVTRFITEYAKQKIVALLDLREQYYQTHDR